VELGARGMNGILAAIVPLQIVKEDKLVLWVCTHKVVNQEMWLKATDLPTDADSNMAVVSTNCKLTVGSFPQQVVSAKEGEDADIPPQTGRHLGNLSDGVSYQHNGAM
jgi:hypothetical protein